MEKSKRKVLFLITKSNWGGAQRYVHDLAVGLPKEDFEAVVALGGDGPLATKLKAANVRVISIPSLQRDISIAKELKAFKEIADIVHEEKPDVLHINSSKAGALGSLIGRLYRVPNIVFTAHGWAFNEDRPAWQRLILKTGHWFTVLLSHRTIAVSREVMRQMNWPFTERKLVVVHNGRDLPKLKSREEAREFLIDVEPKLAPYHKEFWSVTIAELHPVKRHDAVIRVMKEVVRLAPHTRHLIIGSGQEKERLQSLIDQNDLQDHVFLLGPVDEAAEYLKAADLFILASRSEAMAYVMIEACIAGLPVVATAVGGLPEVIDNEVGGLLTPPLDDGALTKAILRLRTDDDLRHRLAAGAKVRSEDFQFSSTLEKTIEQYRST